MLTLLLLNRDDVFACTLLPRQRGYAGAFPGHVKSIMLVHSRVMSGLGIERYTMIFKSKQLTALTPIYVKSGKKTILNSYYL